MSCSPIDLKDYFLKELPGSQRSQVEAHVKTCAACREELVRLQLTGSALFALRDEEIPQRIAFVSDKIFEPSALSRWWGAFWGSTARLGFASAAMLAAGLIFYSLRPAPVRQIVMAPAPQIVQPASLSEAEIQARVDTAVAKAVAQSEARQTEKTKQLVAELERTRQRLLVAAGEFDYYQKKANRLVISANNYSLPPLGNQEVK